MAERLSQRAKSMRLGTTLNLQCESNYSTRSRLEEKAVSPVSGAHARLKCLQSNISPRVGATETNAPEEVAKISEELDKAEVANQVWETVHSRIKSYRRALPPGKGDQESFAAR